MDNNNDNNKKGTCLQDTFWFLRLQDNPNNYTIIHAIVERWSDGLRHPHAAIYNKGTGNIHEVSNQCKDKHTIMPFKHWIVFGKVSDVKQYTLEEMQSKIYETRTWDFYHLNLDGTSIKNHINHIDHTQKDINMKIRPPLYILMEDKRH